ncbi:MAG: hypothetical protein ACKPKO_48040, partial [Candidatus Fonsibacter sp.]
TTGIVEFDLPTPLQIIDTEQRYIFSAIGTYSAFAHVIHGLAGSGKSMLLQCLNIRAYLLLTAAPTPCC